MGHWLLQKVAHKVTFACYHYPVLHTARLISRLKTTKQKHNNQAFFQTRDTDSESTYASGIFFCNWK